MRTRNYNFDIDKHSLIKPVVIIRSGDHDIDTIRVTLSEQGDLVDLTKATVKFMGTTPAGNKIIDDVHIKIVDATTGIFEYTFPSAAGASVGEYQDAYFSIIMGNGQTSTMNFRIQVLSGVDISAPAASDYVSHYNTLVASLNSAYDSATKATNQKMASTVSSLATSAATVLDSALARVNNVNSTANNASSAASNAVSMAASVASTVTSQASYINSVASSAVANVSSTASNVVNKLNNLSIGGRNLMLGTADWSGGNARWDYRGIQPDGTYRGNVIAATSKSWNSPIYLMKNAGVLQVGKTYTFSTYVRNTSDTDTNVAIYYNGDIVTPTNIATQLPAHTDWTRVYTTFKVIKDPTTSNSGLRWESQKDVINGQIQFTGYKLEEGNIATDWTPAPEDIDNKLNNISVGGRNLLLDTGRSFTGVGSNSTGGTFNAQGGMYYLAGGKKVSDLYNKYGQSGYLTLSFDWAASGSTISGTFNSEWNATPWAGLGIVGAISVSPTNTSGHYKITVPLNTSGYSTGAANAIHFRQDNLQCNVTISNVKLEAGNIATDWSPAPEDAPINDAQLVHKTGNETVAGDKTLTGKLSATTFEAGGDKYTSTATATANYLGSTITFMRIGKLVTFTSSITSFKSDVAIGETSGVIPVGFRPALQQNVNTNGQAKGGAFFSFDGAGAIYSYTTYPSGTQPRVSGTYITTDAWPNN